ncbi:hypothetical protein CRW82_09035 [Salmonella enterica subsp. enterica serovar Newport]|nr:hypothetical protein [Salmonella enterica subsp. enterica serovar Newport]
MSRTSPWYTVAVTRACGESPASLMVWLTRRASVPSSICLPVLRGSAAVRAVTVVMRTAAGAQPDNRVIKKKDSIPGRCFIF